MRKTREHSVVLACVMALLGRFAWMMKFVFFYGNGSVSSPRFPIIAGAPGSFTFLIGTDRTISRHHTPV